MAGYSLERKTIQTIFNCVADVYDETRIIPDHIIKEAASILNEKKILGDNQTILDLGFGTGKFSKFFTQNNTEYIGLDFSSKMLQSYKERNGNKAVHNQVQLIQGDITKLPFNKPAFDLILAIHVMDFVKKSTVIEEIKKVIKPNGLLITINYTNPLRETSLAKKFFEHYEIYSNKPKTLLFSRLKKSLPNLLFDKLQKRISWYKQYQINKSSKSRQKIILNWKQNVYLPTVLAVLEKNIYSDCYDLSTESLNQMINKLRAWKEKNLPKEYEEVNAQLELKIIRF